MPFEPEQDERKISAYLGIPKGREVICMDTSAAYMVHEDGQPLRGNEGYRIAHVGVLDDSGVEPTDGPCMTFRATDGTSRVYRLWLAQVYRPGHPLAAERRWHPDLDIHDAIVGLDERHAQRDVLAADRGHKLLGGYLALLALQARGGRRKGDGSRWLSDQEAMVDIDRGLREGVRAALALATRYGVDRSTIYRRVKSATGKRFSEYVSSREFAQHRGR
jgi:hypothetical protein